jgi:hypothetical protein
VRRIFERAGVDYAQWRALTRATLLIEFRTMGGRSGRASAQVKATGALLGLLVFYTMFGGMISLVVWVNADLFVSALIVVAYAMFMVGTAALLDHNAAITSPDDYLILGPRPVDSRTYFAARATNVFVYTLAMTTVFAYLPLLAFLVRHGAGVALGATAAVYASTGATTLTMVVSYVWLMRVVGPARLKRLLSYVQMLASFFVYGGFVLVAELIGPNALKLTVHKTAWLLALPPVWFASYVEIAAGRLTMAEVGPAVLSLVVVAGLVAAAGGRLSLDYADRLGAVMSASAARAGVVRQSRRALWFRRDEARAVALLIRAQFRNDLKFRMGVLAILPLTILYIVMGLREGEIGDPFVRRGYQGFSMITMAVLMFPSMLRMNLIRSDAYKASWIFFATPVDRVRIVRAAKNLLLVTFLLPYLAAVGLLLAWLSPYPSHTAVHLLVIALLSHLALQTVIFLEPDLPFSRPLVKGSSSSRVFMVMMIVGASAVLLPLAAPIIYRSVGTIAITLGGLLTTTVILDWLTVARIQALVGTLEYE